MFYIDAINLKILDIVDVRHVNVKILLPLVP